MTFSPPAARRALPVLALACFAVLATGCGPDDSSTGAAPAASSTAAKSAASTPAASTPAASAPGKSAAPGGKAGTSPAKTTTKPPATAPGSGAVAPCATRDLKAKLGSSQGAAGSTYTVIDFTNLKQTACTLYGYPGVSLAGGTPVNQIGPAADRSTAAPRQLVTLKPGGTANALLRIVAAGNYDAAQCKPATATYLQIYPPGQTTPIYLAHTSPACGGEVHLLTIGVVLPGAGSAM